MKWMSLAASHPVMRIFNLIDASKIREVLRYNPQQRSVRVSHANGQRVFFIEPRRFQNNHLVFCNEYGFAIGSIHPDSMQPDRGTMEFGSTRMQYTLAANPEPEMVLFEEGGLNPIASCGLPEAPKKGFDDIVFIRDYAFLLWSFCWYILDTGTPALPYRQQALSMA